MVLYLKMLCMEVQLGEPVVVLFYNLYNFHNHNYNDVTTYGVCDCVLISTPLSQHMHYGQSDTRIIGRHTHTRDAEVHNSSNLEMSKTERAAINYATTAFMDRMIPARESLCKSLCWVGLGAAS